MRPLHLVLALALIFIWGFNFVVIHEGLREIPPITLCVIRFLLAAFPAVFFIRRPDVPWRVIIAYGMTMFVLQFAFLFGGMSLGISPGLSSIALQLHVFVTMILAVLLLGERPNAAQIAGALLALGGMALIGLHLGGEVSLPGLAGVLLAAVAWGVANVMVKRMGRIDMFALVVWGSLVAPLPLFGLALAVEGPDRMWAAVTGMTWLGAGAAAYIVYPVTLFGFSFWGWLLARYPAATVVPLTLLVPIVGIGSSAIVLGEKLQGWKITAALLVMAGLCINMFGPGWAARFSWKRG